MKGPKDAVSAGEDAWGGLTGTEIGEAYGVGGLGLVGTGRGGGGTGEGTIGLGNTGLIGKGGDGGTGSGYGRGSGAGFGGRGTSVPIVRQAKATVAGALDKDIIRRIVRAHINEVRYCYNQGLARDPSLAGRVSINFTISEVGKVSASVVGETTLKDAAVGSCIAQSVRRWSFARPKTGTVEVSYPFVLETDGSPAGDVAAAPATDQRYVLDADLPKAPPRALPQTGAGTPEWSGRRWSLDIDHVVKPARDVLAVAAVADGQRGARPGPRARPVDPRVRPRARRLARGLATRPALALADREHRPSGSNNPPPFIASPGSTRCRW